MTLRRGCVYWVTFPDVEERKLGLLVSADNVSQWLKPVLVQLTSRVRERSLPTFVRLEPGEGGVIRPTYALCHEVHTLEKELLSDEPLGLPIPARRLVEVEHALMRALDLDEAA